MERRIQAGGDPGSEPMTNSAKEQKTRTGDANPRSGRRSAVKKIVLTSGVVTTSQLPDLRWTKPVVESVVMPAHAQTSDGGDVAGY